MTTNSTVSYESCFDSLAGTPTKKRQTTSALAPSSSKRGTPASSSRNNRGDRFIPQRSAMDLDISHFELTRATDNENANVNASPAKEECTHMLAPPPSARFFAPPVGSRVR